MHRYRQIHTTSTKCQYQAAASKPKWWPLEKWWAIVRLKHTRRNVDPIKTWAPWNPVATKNVDPYTLSEILNEASAYSPAWRIVKYIPNVTVKIKAWIVFERLFSSNLWCAHVTVTPEARRTAVFSRGTLKGFKGVIPAGGQQQPSSGVGDNLLWKNAQKKAKKKRTSDVINRIIPHRSPDVTYDVWNPINVPSRTTSRHHWIIDRIIRVNDKIKHKVPCPWNHLARPIAKVNAPIDAVNGHGLYSTRW